MDRVRILLAGCGKIAGRHATCLERIPEAVVLGVADPSEEARLEMAKRFKVPAFDSPEAMLDEIEADAVDICTPSGSHASIGIAAAERGLHVIVEKPMALRLDDADRLIESCDRAGVGLFVVMQNRYNRPVQALRRAVESGRFGRMVLGSVRVRWSRDQRYYDSAPWRGTWAEDGGVLANQAHHHIDLLLWMMGPVEEVHAYSATRLVEIEVDDTAVAVLKFASGAMGIIEATTATRPRDIEGSISVLGEKGSVEIGGFAANELRHWAFSYETPEDDEIRKNRSANPPERTFAHHETLSRIVRAIMDDSPGGHLVHGIEGRRSLELINAIYESVETSSPVRLLFRPKRCRLGRRD